MPHCAARTLPLAALVLTCAACGGTAHFGSASPPQVTIGMRRPPPTSTAPTSTSTLQSTTTTISALPAPTPLTPLVSPTVPGEGVWQSAGDRVGGAYAVYTTELRATPGGLSAGLARIDPRLSRVSLYAGVGQPYGLWPQEGAVAATAQPELMAAFNGGFKIYSYRAGWYDQGRTAMPLQAGSASLVVFADGTATVGAWGRDVNMGANVVAVRQNLTLLVDHGAISPTAADPAAWGAVLGGGAYTWRSGIGVTASGALIYAGGAGLDPEGLASVLVAAGTIRAMELDINPQWVSFSIYQHPAGIGGTAIVGRDLLPGMFYGPSHYFVESSRDFFAVFARQP